MKQGKKCKKFLQSQKMQYAFFGLGSVAAGLLLVVPLSGPVGWVWTLMSAGFTVYTVFFHPFEARDGEEQP